MSEVTSISAFKRDRAGKGGARATRREGRVPGVVYGGKQAPVLISFDPRHIWAELNKSGFYTRIFDIAIEGGSKEHCLCRDVQFHPVTDQPVHIDFLRVSKETKVHVNVAVHFINQDKSPGLKRGGVLNIVRHDVEVVCGAEDAPSELVVDLTGLEIGDSVHISAVKLPAGVTPAVQDRDFTIATIAAPTVAPAAAEGSEG